MLSPRFDHSLFTHDGELIRLPMRRNSGVRGGWTPEEHERFLDGLEQFPHGPWNRIAAFVRTRSEAQVHSHAQKYRKLVANHRYAVQQQKGVHVSDQQQRGPSPTSPPSELSGSDQRGPLPSFSEMFGHVDGSLKERESLPSRSGLASVTSPSEVAGSSDPFAGRRSDPFIGYLPTQAQEPRYHSYPGDGRCQLPPVRNHSFHSLPGTSWR